MMLVEMIKLLSNTTCTAFATKHTLTLDSFFLILYYQVDLNFGEPMMLVEMIKVLLFYVSQGAKIVRLDAIGRFNHACCVCQPLLALLYPFVPYRTS
jgi:hypothetical protein